MKLTFGLFCFFAFIITIGAPPVVENVNKNKPKAAPEDDADTSTEDAVRRNNFLTFILFFL
jgi:hypothetical protein